jgi:3-methyl-2-oxobutanoate hydroxymethyltransferase
MSTPNSKLTALTAYDYSMAKIFDSCEIDIILVGDSLGNVIKGEENTLNVSMTEMIYHTTNVARGVNNALLIADMPYQSDDNKEKALTNAKSLIAAGAEMVKIEGAKFDIISHLIANNIRVCSHLGLEPQSIRTMGLKVQGRDDDSANTILNNALQLEKLGVELLVLECIPYELAKKITNTLSQTKTIGIGAGNQTDGQILVGYDMLGISENNAKFVLNFGKNTNVLTATQNYITAVKNGDFPDKEHSYH